MICLKNVNKKLILVILIPSVVSFLPLYYFALDYMSYLYWIKEASYHPYKCSPGERCRVDTPSICKRDYETHNADFSQTCVIHRFDGEYGTIQFISVGISIIPTVVGSMVLFAIYLKKVAYQKFHT